MAATRSRWLLVVGRDQHALYRHLEQRFRDLPFVEVLCDRRRGERRLRIERTSAEHRRRERRQPTTAREREQWLRFRYRLVYRGKPLSPTVASLAR